MKSSLIFKKQDFGSIVPIQCGEENCSPGHEFGGQRSYYLLHIVVHGKGEFSSAGKKWALAQGDAFLVFPQEKHLYKADMKSPWKYFWLAFEGELGNLFHSLSISQGNPILHSSDVQSLYNLYREISEMTSDEHPGRMLEINALFQVILARILKERDALISKPFIRSKVKENHAKSMKDFILTYYNTPIKVRDVINFVQLERSYASKLFKDETSQSIGHFLKEVRMKMSAEFLLTGLSVKETAYAVGFSDYENFLKTFKKYHSQSPSQFRLENA